MIQRLSSIFILSLTFSWLSLVCTNLLVSRVSAESADVKSYIEVRCSRNVLNGPVFISSLSSLDFSKKLEKHIDEICGKLNSVSKIDGDLEKKELQYISSKVLVEEIAKDPWFVKLESKWSFGKKIFSLPSLTIGFARPSPFLVAVDKNTSWLVSNSCEYLETLETVSENELIAKAAELPRLEGLGGGGFYRSVDSQLKDSCQRIQNIEKAGGLPFDVEGYVIKGDGSLLVKPLEFYKYPRVALLAADGKLAKNELSKFAIVFEDLSKRTERPQLIDLRYGEKAIVDYNIQYFEN